MTNKANPSSSLSNLLLAAAAMMGLSFPGQSEAVTITGTVSFDAVTSLYSYSYSVTNTGSTEDIALITFPVSPAGDLVNISAPAGFDLTFDPSQGQVNFNEDSSILTSETFSAGSTVEPFMFDSLYGPALNAYMAFDAAGTEFTGFLQTPSAAPVAVPESIFAGLYLGLTVMGMAVYRSLQSRRGISRRENHISII